jgi:acyl-CoA synthetase (AMP-forming)/AMP-acid ligase II
MLARWIRNADWRYDAENAEFYLETALHMVRETKATILLGTDTFLQGWWRAGDAGDFDTVKFVVAGAERVKEETRRMWSASGTVLLEGYGVTECAPVVSLNTLEGNRPGTVGRMVPEQEYRLDPVEGLEEGGRLVVRGPNVMAGYIPERALREFLRRGGRDQTGLDDLARSQEVAAERGASQGMVTSLNPIFLMALIKKAVEILLSLLAS